MRHIADLKRDLLVLVTWSGGGEDPRNPLCGPCKEQSSINLRRE